MSERVLRFTDPVTGVGQITAFPETPPVGDTDLEVRIRHFTEIESFTFLGYILAHEIDEEELADKLNDVGLNWEHFVASTNDKMIPGSPLKITDAAFQAKIDALDQQTEELVMEINRRARERAQRALDLQQKETKEG